MIKSLIFIFMLINISCVTSPSGQDIISDIGKSTKTDRLSKDGLYHTHRKVAGSSLVAMDFVFYTGISAVDARYKILPGLLFQSLSYASESYSREDIVAIMEKTGTAFSCSAGIEFSKCHLMTIGENLPKVMPVVVDILMKPKFDNAHVDLVKKRAKANIRSQFQDPNFLANEAANKIFYNSHPFWTPYEDRLKQIDTLSPEFIKDYYNSHILKTLSELVSVSSRDIGEEKAVLKKYFADFKIEKHTIAKVPLPKAVAEKAVVEDFKNPTAYFTMKMPMPGINHKDSSAANFMMKILDEELSLEIRTKKSLSYSIYSYLIDYSMGIGVIGGSTSKPKETIEAISMVVKKLKDTLLNQEDVERHKNVYVTSLFLEMEGHSSLVASMAKGRVYSEDATMRIKDVVKIQSLKNTDVQAMAQRYLKDFKVGIVFDKDKLDMKWFEVLP